MNKISQLRKVKCPNCGYIWKTKSKLLSVTCPSCQLKTKILSNSEHSNTKSTKENGG